MASEAGLWNHLRNKAQGRDDIRLERVENVCGTGMADVNYLVEVPGSMKWVEGWIELKERDWPRRASTGVKVKFEDAQPTWLAERDLLTDRVYVLLQCDRDYMLFRGRDAFKLAAGVRTSGQMLDNAVMSWTGSIDIDELCGLLGER